MPKIVPGASVVDISAQANAAVTRGNQKGATSILARGMQALRYVISGVGPGDWFGPGQPLPPQAQDQAYGRRWDFPPSYNLVYPPRANENVSFNDMRALAENCDILRLVIETRKDQVDGLDWKVAPKPRPGEKKAPDTKPFKDKIAAIEKLLNRPQHDMDWSQWIRAWLEDMFVIDAATFLKRRNRGGELIGLDLIDGATISPRIAGDGRTPEPPDVAYQQILHGIPAVDYTAVGGANDAGVVEFTAAELVYYPRNLRSSKVYGYSPVEQIIITINTAIRRALFNLEYYKDGNQPDAFYRLPETWTPDQIKQFQKMYDEYFDTTNPLGLRRKLKFMPGSSGTGQAYIETKTGITKDSYDDYLTRIICFAFSISPQPLIQMMNRATAESAHDQAIEEGLGPILRWMKRPLDRIIAEDFGAPELEFQWQLAEEQDPQVASEIAINEVKVGLRTIDEVRAGRGEDAFGGAAAQPLVLTATGYVPLERALDPPAPPPGLGGGFGGPGGQPGGPGGQNGPGKGPGGGAGAKGAPGGGNAPGGPKGAAGGPAAAAGKGNGKQPAAAAKPADGGKGKAAPAKQAKPAAKLAKRKKLRGVPRPVHGLPEDHPMVKRTIAKLKASAASALDKTRASVETQLRARLKRLAHKMAKAEGDPPDDTDMSLPPEEAGNEADQIVDDLDLSALDALATAQPEDLAPLIGQATMDILAQLGLGEDERIVEAVNTAAIDIIQARGAELVGMRRLPNGRLVPNPNPDMAITETIRAQIRAILAEALTYSFEPDYLIGLIAEAGAFSESRAETIARTETRMAVSDASLLTYQMARDNGVDVEKVWLPGPETNDECLDNARQGPIPLDDNFDSGDDAPPAHPNCVCAISAVVYDSAGNESDAADNPDAADAVDAAGLAGDELATADGLFNRRARRPTLLRKYEAELAKFRDDQTRDDHGRFAYEGASGSSSAENTGGAGGAGPSARAVGRSDVGPGSGGGSRVVSLQEAQAAADRAAGGEKPLAGLPQKPIQFADGSYFVPGPNAAAREAARAYMAKVGLQYDPPTTYQKVDPEKATRIAQAFEDMPHDPGNPEVAKAYDAMINETMAQWQTIKDTTGLKVDFIPPGQPDPYGENPRLAMQDVRDNNHMWVFPTVSGFGSGPEAAAAREGNPLLRDVGETINGHAAVANDIFRIVHDYFGHFKEGVGFRAAGEDNAWRSHASMFSPLALRAMTTETRGQNSWVNFGPYGETNRTASGADTHYAPQKIGLLPDWTMVKADGGDLAKYSDSQPRDDHGRWTDSAPAMGEGSMSTVNFAEGPNPRRGSEGPTLTELENAPSVGPTGVRLNTQLIADRARAAMYGEGDPEDHPFEDPPMVLVGQTVNPDGDGSIGQSESLPYDAGGVGFGGVMAPGPKEADYGGMNDPPGAPAKPEVPPPDTSVVIGHLNPDGTTTYLPGYEPDADFARKYSDNQPRDEHGRWTSDGGAPFVADTGRLNSTVATALAEKGGFTFHPKTGATPTEGYAVGGYGTRDGIYDAASFNKDKLDEFFYKNNHALKGKYLGGWISDGKVYLDVTKVFPPSEREAAISAGKAKNQIAIADLGALAAGKMDSAFIDTGGTGKSARSKPKHFLLDHSKMTTAEMADFIRGLADDGGPGDGVKKYSPDQARDEKGRFASGGGSGPAGASETGGGAQGYVDQALHNLMQTSRTAQGIVSTASAPGKSDKMVEGLTGEKAAVAAKANVETAVRQLYAERNSMPTDAKGMLSLMDRTADQINAGIVKEGARDRTADTVFPGQTKAADLPAAKAQFADEFAARLANPHADPVETAAWVEWRVNLTDHFYADGCGKTSRALAAIPLMRAGLPLPQPVGHGGESSFYPTERVDPKGGGAAYLTPAFRRFNDYYHSIMPVGFRKYSEDQPRDDHGRWSSDGGSGGGKGGGFTAGQRDAFEAYTGMANRDLNHFLRNGTPPGDPENVDVVMQDLDAAFKGRATTKDMTVYRGLSDRAVKQFDAALNDTSTGGVFVDKCFVSTTTDQTFAATWKDGNYVEIKLPAGSPAIDLNRYGLSPSHDDEMEVLINRGQAFRVTGVRDGKVSWAGDPPAKIFTAELVTSDPRQLELPFGKAAAGAGSRHDRFIWDEGDIVFVPKAAKKYSEDQPRDDHGRFAEGAGGGGAAAASDAGKTVLPALRPDGPIVFHGTSQAMADSIQKEGLKAERGKGTDEFVTTMVDKNFEEGRPASVYFAGSPINAEDYAKFAAKATGSDPVVFPIRLSKDQAAALVWDEKGGPGDMGLQGVTIAPSQIGIPAIGRDAIGKLTQRVMEEASAVNSKWFGVFPPSTSQPPVKLLAHHVRDAAAARIMGKAGAVDTLIFAVMHASPDAAVKKYSEDQPRDYHGRWTDSGGGGGATASEASSPGGGAATGLGPASSLFAASGAVRLTADEIIAKSGAADRVKAVEAKIAEGVPTNALVSEGGFKNPDGTYTAERQALHDRIVDEALSPQNVANALPADGEAPTMTILGGRGGSGKSWVTSPDKGGPVDPTKAIYLNPDDIQGKLPGYQGWNAALYHEEASDIADQIDARARGMGVNVIHDATMRSGDHGLCSTYADAGYKTQGIYVYASPEVAATRAFNRWASGGETGRYVPVSVMLGNTSNEKKFDALIPKFDSWKVYSSNDGFPPKLIASSK